MISELSLAVNNHLHACDIANTIHPFPTWGEAIRVAASNIKCI
jgi:pyruvate/2-oxoglutarate dehydrogenase complex dihydrolipoamide dehydrogenase (E3) component